MSIIEVNELKKSFKDVNAINGLTLSVNKGELFSLLGENGAGKTTAIKVLCGLLSADSGSVRLFETTYSENEESIKSRINLSPQESAFAPYLTVEENVKLIASLYGLDREEMQKRTEEIINTLSLNEVKKRKAKTLSGGTKRRLSIAMALVTKPEILFLDEPTLGLDVRARRELWKVIESLKGKVTVILTTHYMEEAEALSDRVGIMQKGKLIALGTVDELLSLSGGKNLEEAFLNLTGGKDHE